MILLYQCARHFVSMWQNNRELHGGREGSMSKSSTYNNQTIMQTRWQFSERTGLLDVTYWLQCDQIIMVNFILHMTQNKLLCRNQLRTRQWTFNHPFVLQVDQVPTPPRQGFLHSVETPIMLNQRRDGMNKLMRRLWSHDCNSSMRTLILNHLQVIVQQLWTLLITVAPPITLILP